MGCVVSIAVAIVVAALPVVWLMGRPYTSTFPRPFDSEVWKAADPSAWPADDTRCGMVADLQLRVGIEGKTRHALSQLLGEPEKLSGDPSASYWLLCPSFLDVWVLRVRWENGRAVDAIVHDT